MADTVKVARYRNTGYFVRYPSPNGTERQFTWTGSKNGRIDIKSIPREVVDYLTMNSTCFDKGKLVIVDDAKEAVEAKEGIADKDSYDKNTHTREEIEALVKGNFKKLEKELNEITIDNEKQFVLSVAQDMKQDLTNGKLELIAKWMGNTVDILFD